MAYRLSCLLEQGCFCMRKEYSKKHLRFPSWLRILFVAGVSVFGFQSQSYAFDVTLRWDANQESGVSGYVIYYKTGKSGDRKKENYTNQVEVPLDKDENPDKYIIEFTVKDLLDGENYAFVVAAFDDNTPRKESATSNEASTDNVPPSAAADLTSSHPIHNDGDPCSKEHTVKMYWTEAVDPDPGSGLGGYSWIFDGVAATVPDGYKDIGEGSTSATDILDDGMYWFHIRAGDKAGLAGVPNWGEAVHYGPICIDTGPPGVQSVYLISEDALEIYFSETGMKNAAVAGNYTFDNRVIVSGATDVTGEGRIFDLSLTHVQSYIIYTMTISENVTDVVGSAIPAVERTIREINDADSDGMADDWEFHWFGDTFSSDGTKHSDGDPNGITDVKKYSVARAHPQWGSNRWNLSPLIWDSDGDGISDKYEVDCGMNPVDASDRDLDLDSDGWSNDEEYLAGYAANDANSPAPAPPQVREVIPTGEGPVPSNSTVAVRLEATEGINIAESSGVTVTITESLAEGSRTYVRNLNDANANGAKIVAAIPLSSGVTTANDLWVAYYRFNDTAMPPEFAPGVTVTVSVEATDIRNDSMNPHSFAFRVQTAEEEAQEVERSPFVVPVRDEPTPGLSTSGVTDTTSALYGAAIIYDSSLPENIGIIPYFGPTGDIPVFDVSGYIGVGVAMNLLPPAVFPSGVTVVIPCPGYGNVSGLHIYYYNGQQWVMACDPAGNVQPGGVGWMVPGSRVNHNGNPSWIEIKVYHFSAVIAATTSGTTVTVETGGGGGGCFIDSLMK